ncbi:MAG: helix-turn-helix domain-containing protein [Oleiphilaceae bacterium]|nr:helix-turn-helix domain-containing protein [Oleiphilaceae bacterium]
MNDSHTLEKKEVQTFSSLLKNWRGLRKWSQLDLALAADISQKHLSFLETGRAKPSREMVNQLVQVLDVPLRDRNAMLQAAGYAPVYRERHLDDGEMQLVRQALAMQLEHHAPFPAVVVDRHWNMVMSNAPAEHWLALLGNKEDTWRRVDPSGLKNVYRLTFHPEGLQPLIGNWQQMRGLLLHRLQREVSEQPGDVVLRKLYDDVLLLDPPRGNELPSADALRLPVMPLEFNIAGVTLSMFSMISGFGTAVDVTADELRIESFFPANEETRVFFERLAQQ